MTGWTGWFLVAIASVSASCALANWLCMLASELPCDIMNYKIMNPYDMTLFNMFAFVFPFH